MKMISNPGQTLRSEPALGPFNLTGPNATGALAATAALLVIAMFTAAAIRNEPGGWVVFSSFVIGTVCCAVAWHLADSVEARTGLIIILTAAAILRVGYLFVDPRLSTDLYRYIWDGRVIGSGINPYRYVPAAPELQALRDPVIYTWINRADYAVTIYPPVAQIYYFLVTRIGQSVFVMKAAMVGCEAIIITALLSLLRRQGRSPLRVAAYAWHPLAIWEIAGNGHIDVLMIAFMTVALLYCLRGSVLLAGVLATCGALVKPTALLALPVFWRPWNWKLVGAVLLTIAVCYLPFLSVGSRVIGFVPQYVAEEGLNSGAGFRLVAMVQKLTGPIPHAATAYVALFAVVMIALALAAGFRRDRSDQAAIRWLGWLLIAFLMLTSPHYPWYFLALVPFLVLAPTASGWVFSTFCALLYAGHWDTHVTRELILTGVMLTALAIDGLRGQFALTSTPVPIGEAL
jgi:alpha-1,6-mannosyltransferase